MAKEDWILQIYIQNVNGLMTKENLKEYLNETKVREVDMWGWAETNVPWTEQMLQKTNFLGSKTFKNFMMVGSSSDDLAEIYQQGGT
eukprot:8667120-Ditylum_brightwellii.AAC.1